MAVLFAVGAEAAGPKRVLIIHSFGRDFAPHDSIASVFRTELAQRYAGPITFVEANLDSGRASSGREEQALVEYLKARFDDAPPDVVATIGGPAAHFVGRHRAEPFAAAPVVMGSLDVRLLKRVERRPGDVVAAVDVELPKLIGNVLQLLPQTETIAVVGGTSELEQFWLRELEREFTPFAGGVRLERLDKLSLAQIQQRLAALPPRSAVLYSLFVVDAAGVPHERQDALASLRAVSSAPIFGVFESELGKGVVGGPYMSQRRNAERMVDAATAALKGTQPSGTSVYVDRFEPAVYDWRELESWRIDESRLPPGSTIRFRPPTPWEEHRFAVVATATALALQALLIGALLAQRRHRRRAELEAEGLAGRLVTAHEDERRRLARELHDDMTQRLAGLAIEAARLEGGTRNTPNAQVAHSIREGITELGEDVHALSYRLHPSVIEDLGLVEALRIECDRASQQGPLRVSFDSSDVPATMPADTALCLFRVAQEALRNVERHAGAGQVKVSVAAKNGGIALAVRDDGVGFDADGERERASLGLASMRERVRLLGGRIHIESRRGSGTALSAWVPLPEAA